MRCMYDGLVSLSHRERMYEFVSQSAYRIGWVDSNDLGNAHKYLHSAFSEDDFNRLGLLRAIEGTEVAEMLKGYTYRHCVVNLSVPTDMHWAHIHRESLVMLYYANVRWREEWAGETLFFNDKLDKIVGASPYVPGRIVLFDGSQPHSIRPQAAGAPQFRFTVSSFWDRRS